MVGLIGSMKRLFGKFSRSQSRAANEAKEDISATPVPDEPGGALPAEEPIDAATPPDPLPERDIGKSEAPDFELREPTPEELAATILSRQDFIDIDRMFAGNRARVVQRAKPPLLAPGVATSAAASSKQTPPVPTIGAPLPVAPPFPAATAPSSPTPSAALVPAIIPETGQRPSSASDPIPVQTASNAKSALLGFVEGFVVGKSLSGWTGDPDHPASRSLRVTALLDGEVVASTSADRDRKDTPYAGFQIPFPDPQVWKYLLENRLVVQVVRADEEPITLRFLPNIIKLAETLREESRETELPTLPSYHGLPVGTESPGGAAIVGGDGFLFGYRDIADLPAQYAVAPDNASVQRDVARWFLLFRDREARLAARGIGYVQTVLPEKATILFDLAPPGLGPITPRLGVLETMFETEAKKDNSAAIYYRSLITALRSCHTAGVEPYFRTGSGLRTAGAQLVFYQLTQRMAIRLLDHAEAFAKIADLCGHFTPGTGRTGFLGDLGKAFGLQEQENENIPDVDRIAAYAVGDAKVVDRRETGSRFIWQNPEAPAQIKVMAFGANCFGLGGGPTTLAWWFKSMFGEFHLVESAALEDEYIEQHRPDIVIAVNQERTLASPPAF